MRKKIRLTKAPGIDPAGVTSEPGQYLGSPPKIKLTKTETPGLYEIDDGALEQEAHRNNNTVVSNAEEQ